MADDRQVESTVTREQNWRLFLSGPRGWLFGLSVLSLIIGATGGVLHYSRKAWGNPWQLIGWLLSLLFLLLACSAPPREIARRFKASMHWKAVFFAFWVLVFTLTRLWHFKTAPWNGDGLFDESGWDLFFLKDYVIGHPYQAAWFHVPISRETLFHYYVWGFFGLFGYNILSYEAALFGIWCVTFLFTILLVDLLFDSRIVTSIIALIFVFLPFSFVYTFAGYRYPMGTAFCIVSLYFLHLGFKKCSVFSLSLGGIAAGLCWASSISGKQYLAALLLFGIIYSALHWKTAKSHFKWSVPIVLYGCLVAAMPLLCYIGFTLEHYTLYEKGLVHDAMITGLGSRARRLYDCFFTIPAMRFFIADALPIPLPYYAFLVPGIALAIWKRRYEIVLLAIIPVAGAFLATAWENRLLLAIPFWMILMAFPFAGLTQLKLRLPVMALLWVIALSVAAVGLIPSIKYDARKTTSPSEIPRLAHDEVAVSRFLRHVVAGQPPRNPPRLERNEFNRITGIPEASYDTLICQDRAYSILHLFLHDYDDAKVLSFCAQLPTYVQTTQQIWTANKKAILNYVPRGKGLKLIWERNGNTERVLRLFDPWPELIKQEYLTLTYEGLGKIFYVIDIEEKNILQFKEKVRGLPDNL